MGEERGGMGFSRGTRQMPLISNISTSNHSQSEEMKQNVYYTNNTNIENKARVAESYVYAEVHWCNDYRIYDGHTHTHTHTVV